MRRLSFDEYEFDRPDSEESLELVISSSRQHPELTEFLSACGASALVGSSPPANWGRWSEVTAHVQRFAGFELPSFNACQVILFSDDWDDLELAVIVGPHLVWYHWWTTA
jgi:hypothetical protein